MANGIDIVFVKNPFYSLLVPDICVFEYIPFGVSGCNIFKTRRVPGISKRIHIDDPSLEIGLFKDISYKIRAYEAGAAGNKYVVELSHIKNFLALRLSLNTAEHCIQTS